MTKTVKEIIKYQLDYIRKCDGYYDGVFLNDLLEDILQAHENELAEKEQEINSFKQQIDMAHNFNQNLGSKIEELKQQILFKEDFLIVPDLNNRYRGYISKEKYDKLPSKDIK